MTEVSNESLAETCEQYIALLGSEDVDSLMALFADDCVVEDPVGSEPKNGKHEVGAFYATLPPVGVSATLTGPVRAVAEGMSAAFPFKIETAGFEMEVIDVMTFNDEGKITSMTAYWKM